MDSFNLQFLYCVIIIALGYFLKRVGIIKESDGDGLSKIIFNITLPMLIIVTINDIKIDPSLFLLAIIAFLYGIFSGFIGHLAFKKETREVRGMLGMMLPGFNIGLFAFPLVEVMWGKEGITYFGMFDSGNSLIVFGLSYFIGSYFSGDEVKLDVKTTFKKVSKSIPLMTFLFVVILNLLGLQLPTVFIDVSEIISVANMPLSLLLLGIYLSFSIHKSQIGLMLKFLGIKYGVGIVTGLLLFFILPFDDMFRYTILFASVLPTSLSVLPYSVEFGYDRKFVGTLSNMTIVVSFILLWLMANILL